MLTFIEQLFCTHADRVIKTDRRHGRIYTECMSCLKTTDGVLTGPQHHSFAQHGHTFQEEL